MRILKKIKQLWNNRPRAQLMRECLELSEKISEDTEAVERILERIEGNLKEKGS